MVVEKKYWKHLMKAIMICLVTLIITSTLFLGSCKSMAVSSQKLDLRLIGADIGCSSEHSYNLENAIDGNPLTFGTIYREPSLINEYRYDIFKDKYKLVGQRKGKPVYIQVDLKDEYKIDNVYVDWTYRLNYFSMPDSWDIFLTSDSNYKQLTGKFYKGKTGRYVTIKVNPPLISHDSDLAEIAIYASKK